MTAEYKRRCNIKVILFVPFHVIFIAITTLWQASGIYKCGTVPHQRLPGNSLEEHWPSKVTVENIENVCQECGICEVSYYYYYYYCFYYYFATK